MVGAFIPALALIGNSAKAAAELTPLDPTDPKAVTLGFIDDTAKVDAVANPLHTADQTCANCAQWLGKASDARGGCVLFAGNSVPAHGWCKVWRKMP